MALAVAVAAGDHGDGTGDVHAHLAHLEQADASAQRQRHLRRRQAAGFDVAGKADAAPLAGRGGGRLARLEPGVVRVRQRFVQARLVVAHVVGEGNRRFVGKVRRLNEVAAADVRRIHAKFPRRGFHHAFHDVGGFRPAGATVGVHRRGVGEQRLHGNMDGRRAVLASQQRAVQIGGHAGGEGGEVGAHVGDGGHAQAQELAVRRQRQLGVGDVIAPVRVRQKGFGPFRPPLHRSAHLAGGPDHRGFFRIDEDLGAEAAADVRRDHAQPRLRRHVHECGQHQPLQVRILRRGVQRVAAGRGVVLAHRGAGFHGIGDQAVVHDVQLGHAGCLGESGLRGSGIAQFPVVALVVRRGLVNLLGSGRGGQIHHRRQRLELRRHRLRAIFGRSQRLGDDDGVGFAHVVHVGHGERRMRRLHHVRAVLGFHHPAAGQIADAVRLQVRAGEHRHHARHGLRRGGVDAVDAGAGMGGAGEHGPRLPGDVDVVRIAPRAGDEAGVLFAPDGGADAGLRCHCCLPCYWPAARRTGAMPASAFARPAPP